LIFTGDINLGTTTLPGGVPPDGGRGLLAATESLLAGDLVVGNFEGALADSGAPEKCDRMEREAERRARKAGRRRTTADRAALRCYAFATPTALAPRLPEAGFTHLNLANNHANDMGPEGLVRTARTFDSLGVAVYGPHGRVALDTLRRGDSLTVVGLVGFATYPFAFDLLDLERTRAVVDSVRRLVDVLIVTFHGGAEGAAAAATPDSMEYLGSEPRGDLRRWARVAIEAGADAVVGHGPHVLRGVEFHRGRPIAYSLGNFLTYRGFSLAPPLHLTAVLQLRLAGDGTFLGGRVIPLVQRPRAGPAPDSTGAALDFVRARSAEDFPGTGAVFREDGSFRERGPGNGER
ncbi:MAG TPA: CapA family protein, partial [Gemmatimonadales bacterium]|nr:CapA family protein [Gemmatimonadales bacterium]